jgi:hypothetical protein
MRGLDGGVPDDGERVTLCDLIGAIDRDRHIIIIIIGLDIDRDPGALLDLFRCQQSPVRQVVPPRGRS